MKASALFLILAAICGAAFAQPQAPTVITTTTVRLTWQGSTDDLSTPGAIRYRVYYLDSATTTTWQLGGETVGTTETTVVKRFEAEAIFFAVQAIDEAGNASGFLPPIEVPLPKPPTIPAGLSIVIRIEYAIKP